MNSRSPRLLGVLLLAATTAHAATSIVEASVDQLQRDMAAGRATAQSITQASLARIRQFDAHGPALNAVLQTNPEAMSIARERDRERKAGKLRGPLHGIPVLLKDNIDTGDRMPTTAGSLALAETRAQRDAFIVRKLRDAGAVILGKTNLSEWANIRSSKSSSGWSAVGGQTKNAYAGERNPCGSSSGTGTAVSASFAVVGIGTETDGSIVCPSGVAGLVGMKPTVGLVSRSGIIPISHSQDTAGPMTRNVADAAAVLSAIAGVDAADAATKAAQGHVEADYRAFLKLDALKGARIGVARKKVTGYSPHTDRLFEQAIADLKRLGAEIVDPADFGSLGDYDDDELEVLLYELKADLNAYLAQRQGAPVKSLADVIAFNDRNAVKEMRYFGQDLFEKAQSKGPLTDETYTKAAEKARRLARAGIDEVLAAHKLDAIIAPTGSPAWLTDHVNGDSFQGSSSSPAAVAGYPTISVTMGAAMGLPVGLSFVGTAWSEGKLLGLAYAYEQGTRHRRAPKLK
ncbi:amidase [Caenimonas aquaedulcis]|uniref:Amidase n=1 Tax=Caenimonas aquaedulcis TaxID=2793270 RepID=A0A931H0W8_9BURK|nr:amidase [Caenimonas aquaedulcis]MBG9386527.1 amidase [Caenimonas aquaedulcis]